MTTNLEFLYDCYDRIDSLPNIIFLPNHNTRYEIMLVITENVVMDYDSIINEKQKYG